MIKYEIKRSGEAHPVPVVVFEEEAYGLAGTFLLAEARSFGAEILSALDEVCVGGRACSFFAGNAFSLEITPSFTKVVDDILGKECRISTKDFREIAGEYCRVCEKIDGMRK
ncbi:MAG: hypothetical protein IKH16_07280 [Selenomonadaceae bacterium]|nr:hypothetical protein [Selenomonadaceae bacterium]